MNQATVFTKSNDESTISNLTFNLYIFYNIDFFIHLSARIPGYGVLRPTLLLVLIITMLLFSQKDKFAGVGQDPIFKAIFALVVYVFISLPLVEWPGSILRHNLPLFVKCVTFFYFTALIIDTDRRLRIFLLVFIACQVFRVLEPLYLHVTQGYWGEWTYLGEGDWARRLAGAPNDIINPNGLGFVIVTVIPYLHYLVWGSEKKLHRIIYIVLMPMLIYALILTMSRGAFLALCVVIWMIFKKSDRKFSMIVIVLISLAGIWSNLNDVQKDRYLSIFRSDMRQSASASGRFSGVLDEVSIGLGAPIFGHGMGTSAEAKFHAGQRARPSHNLYTEVFIEVGIIGFFLFFSFIRSIYLSFKRNIERFKELDTTDRMFVNRLNTTFIAIFWMYVVFSANYFGLSTYYWYLFAGLTVAFPRIYFPTAEPGNEKRGN